MKSLKIERWLSDKNENLASDLTKKFYESSKNYYGIGKLKTFAFDINNKNWKTYRTFETVKP